jgi:hypothetical protein
MKDSPTSWNWFVIMVSSDGFVIKPLYRKLLSCTYEFSLVGSREKLREEEKLTDPTHVVVLDIQSDKLGRTAVFVPVSLKTTGNLLPSSSRWLNSNLTCHSYASRYHFRKTLSFAFLLLLNLYSTPNL